MSAIRFKNFASIMIAVATILGAMAACLGSVAANQAGSADFEGLNAAINAQEAEIISGVTTYEHYRAYTDYFRYNELGVLLYEESLKPGVDAERNNALGILQREVWGLATGLQYDFFPPRYLKPEGGYNLQRELDERFADAEAVEDLHSETHFFQADSLRTKSLFFTIVLMVITGAFWCFTVAQVTDNWLKYLFAGLGLLITLAGLGAGIAIQFFT